MYLQAVHHPVLPPKQNGPVKFGAFQRVPFSIQLHQNQVWNRAFLDLFGWGGGAIVFARNKFERVEKALDLGCWWLIGLGAPILLDKLVNRRYYDALRREFRWLPKPINSKVTLLRLPFEWLDTAGLVERTRALNKNPAALKRLREFGLKSYNDLLNPRLRQKVLNGKLILLVIDLVLMASKGQIYYWGKNLLTKYWSGKEGYSGEFKYAHDEYLKQKTAGYEKTKKLRAIASVVIGYGAALAFPLIMGALLRSKARAGGKGLIAKVKQLIPAFNYEDTVYMSKWVMLWHNIFNWNLPSLLSARDTHELRENFIKTSLIDFFYFVGDSLLAGYGAQFLQQKYKVPLLRPRTGKAWWNQLPRALPLSAVFEKHGKASTPYFWAKTNMWVSLGINALILSVLTPVLNNWFTYQKVTKEQRQLGLKPKTPASRQGNALMNANQNIYLQQPSARLIPGPMPYPMMAFPGGPSQIPNASRQTA